MRYRITILASLLFACAALVMAQPAPRSEKDPAPSTPMKKAQIEGTVESVQGQRAVIKTPEGRHVNVDLGPQRYWRERGYHMEPGVRVRVQGWTVGDDYDGPFFAGTIFGPHFRFTLSDGYGYPGWADPNDYADGWYPTYNDYYYFYCGTYGPPFWWGWGPPPPPRWWYRHHPGWRGWDHRGYYGRGPRAYDRDQNDRGRGDNRDHRDNGDNRDNRGGDDGNHQRGGRHGG